MVVKFLKMHQKFATRFIQEECVMSQKTTIQQLKELLKSSSAFSLPS